MRAKRSVAGRRVGRPSRSPRSSCVLRSLRRGSAAGHRMRSLLRLHGPRRRPKGGWKNETYVEIAVPEYVDWFNHRRLHGEIGLIPPAEFEADHWASVTPEHYPETPVPTRAGSK